MEKAFKAAIIQDAPILFDLSATMQKTGELLESAADLGARLTLFPEAFIPAYPRGLTFGTVVGSRSDQGRKLWQLYLENSIEVPGKETSALGKLAKKSKCFLAIGVIEKDSISRGTLYCAVLYFGPDGSLLGKHRKL